MRKKKNDAKNTFVKNDSKKIPIKNDAKIVHQEDPKKKEISQKIKQGKWKKQEQAAKTVSARHTQSELSKISKQDNKSSKFVAQSDLRKKKNDAKIVHEKLSLIHI